MRQLGVFAKFWEPGAVKTRLAAAIGGSAAARVHQACVSTLITRFNRTADRRVLCFTPAEREREFAAIAGPAWQLQPQATGDLGRRMRHYFETSFAAGVERAVLIGSDSPTLPITYVEEAFDRLAESPVVLGPSDDGGYYLIGLSRDIPDVFQGIDWSTSEVWRQTIGRLRAAGQSYYELPPWYDVDTGEDLLRLRDELTGPMADDVTLDALRQAIGRWGKSPGLGLIGFDI
ncbi:MAG TPA: TIGR04282 family arsenosugar biosynthesis glycosyltransferase [Pirellulales bacterium]|nr:TIGR04282 family arsenosugar biosynthesis glycosyltransferase [Pirellulales bacterium]